MTTRSTVDKGIQLGVEVTPGTLVAANRRIPTLDINWSPNVITRQFRSAGRKFNGASVVDGAHMGGGYSGPLDYNSIIYPWASYVGVEGGAPTTPSGGTLSRKWRFVPAMTGRDSNQKTYTVERGDSVAAQVATFVQFASFVLRMRRSAAGAEMGISGDVFGRFPDDGQALTGSPTTIAQRPAAGGQVRIYADSTWAGIGGTIVSDAYEAGQDLGTKFSPYYAYDAGSTFKDTSEQAPPASFNFATAHTAQSRAFFANLVQNAKYFMRFLIEGATLEGAIKEKIQFDMVGRLTGAEERDNDGVFGYNYSLAVEEDSTFNSSGGALLLEVINLLTGL
jgi:hypothetical protein